MLAIGCYEGKSLLSRMIKRVTGSRISHVSVIYLPDAVVVRNGDHSTLAPVGSLRWQRLQRALETAAVFEAWGELLKPWRGGVFKRRGIDAGHTPGTVIHLMQLLPDIEIDEVAVIQFLEAHVAGKTGYDYMGLVRFLVRSPIDNSRRFFCSELVHTALALGGVQLTAHAAAHRVSPGDIFGSGQLQLLCTVKTKEEPAK